MAKIHVVSTIPGRHRGGRANPIHAAYEDGDLTAEQLRDLISDPAIRVISGDLVDEDMIAAMAAKPVRPRR